MDMKKQYIVPNTINLQIDSHAMLCTSEINETTPSSGLGGGSTTEPGNGGSNSIFDTAGARGYDPWDTWN